MHRLYSITNKIYEAKDDILNAYLHYCLGTCTNKSYTILPKEIYFKVIITQQQNSCRMLYVQEHKTW
jgi:hypothetical protein